MTDQYRRKPSEGLPFFNDGTIILTIEERDIDPVIEWHNYLSIRCVPERRELYIGRIDHVVRCLNVNAERASQS